MSAHPLIKELPAEIAFYLGQLFAAHSTRRRAREHAAKLNQHLHYAKNALLSSSMYCRESAEEEVRNCRDRLSDAVRLKCSAEKHYKRLKYEFIEQFPQYAGKVELMKTLHEHEAKKSSS